MLYYSPVLMVGSGSIRDFRKADENLYFVGDIANYERIIKS